MWFRSRAGTPTAIATEGSNSPAALDQRFEAHRLRLQLAAETPQVWIMNADGSDQKAITSTPTGAGDVTVSPDDKWIVFNSDVYPECTDDACNKTRAEAEKNNKVKARVYTSLLYRHWTDWQSSTTETSADCSARGGTSEGSDPGRV